METTNARYEKKNSQMETGITFASYVHSRGKGFLLGELEDGVGSKRILLFQCHAHEERCRERLQILRYFNPALPIHFLYGGDAKDAPKFHALAGEFGAGFWEYSVKGRNGRWKWKHYDLVLREWYRQYGKNLDFTHLYSYEWDVLTAAPLHLIFPRLNTNAVYLTPVRAFTKNLKKNGGGREMDDGKRLHCRNIWGLTTGSVVHTSPLLGQE